jgi:hypothetical protein
LEELALKEHVMQRRSFDRFRRVLMSCVLSLLIALASSTPAAAASAKGALPPDLVAYFSGNWTGSGAFVKSGKPLASDYSFVPDIENQCLVVHQKEKPPYDFEFVALWSVNSDSGQVVMLLVSNHGSGARVFHGSAWQEGRLSFETAPEDPKVPGRERFTFERDSTTAFHTMYEYSQDGGKTWAVGDRQSFTKTP